MMNLKSDAVDNVLGAILIAGQYLVPEVSIFFGNKLLRGNRSTKKSASKVAAFVSPNAGVLADVGVSFNFHWNRILNQNFDANFKLFTQMDENISIITITPCLNYKILESTF